MEWEGQKSSGANPGRVATSVSLSGFPQAGSSPSAFDFGSSQSSTGRLDAMAPRPDNLFDIRYPLFKRADGRIVRTIVEIVDPPLSAVEKSSLNIGLGGAWAIKIIKSDKALTREDRMKIDSLTRQQHIQRCPALTVDTIFLSFANDNPDGEISVLIGIWDKEVVLGDGSKRRIRCLVFPGGGHEERIGGGRVEGLMESGHSNADEAANEEVLDEIGLTKNDLLWKRKLTQHDGVRQDERFHLKRAVYAALISSRTSPKVSDEIKNLRFVTSNQLTQLVKGETSLTDPIGVCQQGLQFGLNHDQMFRSLADTEIFKAFIEGCKYELRVRPPNPPRSGGFTGFAGFASQ